MTLRDLSWPHRTARLSLRPAAVEDAEATWRFRRLPEVTRWLSSGATERARYQERFVNPERLARMLVIEREREVIGDLIVRVQDAWAQVEIADQAQAVQAELGWCLDPRHHHHGYGAEAVRELIRICFEELGLRRVTAECFADNERSWRLMERVGMRRESHTVKDALHRSGRWLDGMSYALLAEEWRSASVESASR